MLQSFSIAFNAIVPLFLIIAVGCILRRLGWLNDEIVHVFNKVTFHTFMPLMLFNNIYDSNFSQVVRPQFLLFCLCAALLLFGLSFAVTLPLVQAPEKRGVIIQAAFRSNFVLLGLPIAMALLPGGDFSVSAIAVAVVVPLLNALAVITLEIFRGGHVHPGRMLLTIMKNPLILGSLCGLLLKVLGWQLPAVITSFTGMMSSAATPVILLLLGASFQWRKMAAQKKELAICVTLRLVVFPALILTIAALMGLRGIEFVTVLAMAAAPTAVNSFNMAREMGGDSDLAASAVMVSTALSFFTLFFWITLSSRLGMF